VEGQRREGSEEGRVRSRRILSVRQRSGSEAKEVAVKIEGIMLGLLDCRLILPRHIKIVSVGSSLLLAQYINECTYEACFISAVWAVQQYVPMTSPGNASVMLSLSWANRACAEERLIVRFMRLCPTFMPFLKVPESDEQ
jgi:hypothetical protein